MVGEKFVMESRLTFSIVVNMLKGVWCDLVSFTFVNDRRNKNVPKHTQNKRFSLSTLWHMLFNMQNVLLCFTH